MSLTSSTFSAPSLMQHSDYDDMMDSDPSDHHSNGSCNNLDMLDQTISTRKQQAQAVAQQFVASWYLATMDTAAKKDVKRLLQSEVFDCCMTSFTASIRSTTLPSLARSSRC